MGFGIFDVYLPQIRLQLSSSINCEVTVAYHYYEIGIDFCLIQECSERFYSGNLSAGFCKATS